MPSIEVTDRAQILVITTPESWTGMCSAASFDHEAVQLNAELNECVRLVGFRRFQKLCSRITENSPQGRRHFPVLPPPGVQIHQTEQDSRGTNAHHVVEISTSPLSRENCSNLGAPQGRKRCRYRLYSRKGLPSVALEKGFHLRKSVVNRWVIRQESDLELRRTRPIVRRMVFHLAPPTIMSLVANISPNSTTTRWILRQSKRQTTVGLDRCCKKLQISGRWLLEKLGERL
jgi:hypothetical protein